MNVLNAAELCTQKWLRWSILCINALLRHTLIEMTLQLRNQVNI